MESLVVKDLKTYYHTYKGYNHAVDGVSFSLEKGEIFGLIGESGCGKSTIGNSLMKMIQFPGEIVGGSILLGENDLVQKSGAELRKLLWKEIAMVPQSAMNAMNPCHKVGKQIMEAISLHLPELKPQQVRERMEELLVSVGLNKKWADAFPHKLSGGMKQRAIIAMALACNPKVIISDEATTGLDVLIEAQILALYRKLAEELDISIIIISHDLHMVSSVCDRIGIMYGGHLVEILRSDSIANARHPYTKALFASQIDASDFDRRVEPINGYVPKLVEPEDQCRFYSRCTEQCEKCSGPAPVLKDVAPNHKVACWREDA